MQTPHPGSKFYLDVLKTFYAKTTKGDVVTLTDKHFIVYDPLEKHAKVFEGAAHAFNLEMNQADVLTWTAQGLLKDSNKTEAIIPVKIVPAPEAADAPGSIGEIAFTATNLYICVDKDTWKTVALSAISAE